MTWSGRATAVQADLVIESGAAAGRSVDGRLVGAPTLLDAAALITELVRQPRLDDGLTAYLAGGSTKEKTCPRPR
jgi:hypothetical protein